MTFDHNKRLAKTLQTFRPQTIASFSLKFYYDRQPGTTKGAPFNAHQIK